MKVTIGKYIFPNLEIAKLPKLEQTTELSVNIRNKIFIRSFICHIYTAVRLTIK